MDDLFIPKQIAKVVVLSSMDYHWINRVNMFPTPSTLRPLDAFIASVSNFATVFYDMYSEIFDDHFTKQFSENQFKSFFTSRCEILSESHGYFDLLLVCSLVKRLLYEYKDRFRCVHYHELASSLLCELLERKFKLLGGKFYRKGLLNYCRRVNENLYVPIDQSSDNTKFESRQRFSLHSKIKVTKKLRKIKWEKIQNRKKSQTETSENDISSSPMKEKIYEETVGDNEIVYESNLNEQLRWDTEEVEVVTSAELDILNDGKNDEFSLSKTRNKDAMKDIYEKSSDESSIENSNELQTGKSEQCRTRKRPLAKISEKDNSLSPLKKKSCKETDNDSGTVDETSLIGKRNTKQIATNAKPVLLDRIITNDSSEHEASGEASNVRPQDDYPSVFDSSSCSEEESSDYDTDSVEVLREKHMDYLMPSSEKKNKVLDLIKKCKNSDTFISQTDGLMDLQTEKEMSLSFSTASGSTEESSKSGSNFGERSSDCDIKSETSSDMHATDYESIISTRCSKCKKEGKKGFLRDWKIRVYKSCRKFRKISNLFYTKMSSQSSDSSD